MGLFTALRLRCRFRSGPECVWLAVRCALVLHAGDTMTQQRNFSTAELVHNRTTDLTVSQVGKSHSWQRSRHERGSATDSERIREFHYAVD